MTGHFFRIIFNSKLMRCLYSKIRNHSSNVNLKTAVKNAEDFSKTSFLFVPGRHGASVYQIVKPLVDTECLRENLGLLKLSCDHRNIDLDLEKTLKLACEWQDIKNSYSKLVEKDFEYSEEIERLKSQSLEKEFEAVNEEKKNNLDKLIKHKSKVHDMEDILMPLLQKIPHILHPNTPLQFNFIDVSTASPRLNVDAKSHTEIARNVLEFPNNTNISYFLSGRLAILDFAIQSYFVEKMCSLGFSSLSCVDFCKSFVIEATGYDPHSTQDNIAIKDKSDRNKKHLVGGASLQSLCAYLTNMNISKTVLPLKYYSSGRHYNASHFNNKFTDLFSVVQSTNVHNLLISDTLITNEFDLMVEQMLSCYSELNLPFRTVKIAAPNLTITESQKTQLELWSPALKEYIPAAYVSQHDDFISKRLQITYGEQHEKEGYCNIVEGAICNTPVIIGCIIENFQTDDGNFNIPESLQNHMDL